MQEMELAEAEIFDDWYKTGVLYQGINVAGESCEKYSPESIVLWKKASFDKMAIVYITLMRWWEKNGRERAGKR